MIHVYREKGPEGFVQIGPRARARPWVTLWRQGFTASLPGDRLLCFRTPRARAYYSERNRIGIRMLAKVGGYRLFVRGPA